MSKCFSLERVCWIWCSLALDNILSRMIFKRWRFFVGIVLLLVATTASALSLGRLRGAALLGRALDVSIQASLDNQEAALDSNCFAADVFYGETRVSPSALNVSAERSTVGEMRIRIRSSVIVDEPIVTVFLRATCSASISRRYVLLVEAMAENEAPQPALAVSPSVPAARSASPASAPVQGRSAATPAESSDKQAQTNMREARKAERAEQRRVKREAKQSEAKNKPVSSVVVQPANSDKASSSRLKLDLLDLTSANLNLRGSYELSSSPNSDPAVRSQAQALWRALNASPEESQRDFQRLNALEIQARASLEQSKRSEKEIAKLAVDLKTAQSQRYVNPLTIGLGILVLAALGFGAWAWYRNKTQKQGQPWWGGKGEKLAPPDEQQLWAHLGDNPDSNIQPLQSQALGADKATRRDKGLLSASTEGAQSAQPPVLSATPQKSTPTAVNPPTTSYKESPTTNSARNSRQIRSNGGSLASSQNSFSRSDFGQTDFATSTFNRPRVVAAEELFDIQEQADFFLSLDQPDQAIEVLKNHITDNVETSALAYMDLFDIYHRTKRVGEFNELREEFNQVFNAQVPEFGNYGTPSLGLEDAPEVLQSIQDAWSMPQQAQDVIEESIFRQPGLDQKPMDMLAYRELMLLYSLAKELARPSAKYSMLPTSMQTAAMPSLTGIAQDSEFLPGADFEFVNSTIASRLADIPIEDTPHASVPPKASAASSKQPPDSEYVDFDLSDSELGHFKLPYSDKKS